MRTLLFFIFAALCFGALAQSGYPGKSFYVPPPEKVKQKYNWKRAIAPASLCFVSGAAWGLHEKTAHHWGAFSQRFPGAKEKFWNPDVSWTNKYRNWPEDKRRTGVPVFFTDAKHILASTTQVTAFTAGAFITLGEKRPWWHYAVDAGISFGAYSAGNYLTFNALYR